MLGSDNNEMDLTRLVVVSFLMYVFAMMLITNTRTRYLRQYPADVILFLYKGRNLTGMSGIDAIPKGEIN